MPWRHTSPLDQNPPVIADDLRDRRSMTARCELYRVSRQTGDTWGDRSLTHGPAPRPATPPTRW
jgi:hypothetical protein